MISHDICLLSALFYCVFILVCKYQSHVKIANLCEAWEVANGTEKLVLLDVATILDGYLLKNFQA
jgi:hypothetical protein